MHSYKKLPLEERLNVISHAVGFVLAFVSFVFLLLKDAHKSENSTLCIIVYSLSLISMFGASTAYHYTKNQIIKSKLRILDHVNIYFLIAGTYTPVALITLINGNGWVIFYTVWIIAVFGTIFKLFYTGKLEYLSLLFYVAMGWLIIFDFVNLNINLSALGMKFLILGGVFYTVGLLFYAIKRIPNNHFIWHLFVLAGAICHWLMIYFAVV